MSAELFLAVSILLFLWTGILYLLECRTDRRLKNQRGIKVNLKRDRLSQPIPQNQPFWRAP